ncbi:zinc finger protein 568-like [Thrips palmi]|uniref:Zinc finger protein 568-like n=1 Tax=Thrips palmi TaxID=161013 RepID=A0A6P8YVW9_THRPL|nr:zinc finger protein 568-like [Thrips palmi]
MRGTVLKLRSQFIDSSSAEDEEPANNGSLYGEQGDLSNCVSFINAKKQPEDMNKNIFISNLDLHESSVSKFESLNIPSVGTTYQRQTFDWNDTSMWKAMSKHPMFPKYMELQSQLNSLFEEIRMDCKRAACEKAFSSLVKNTADSPIVATPCVVVPVPVSNTVPSEVPCKRRGRPPLKKKPGRPRKDASAAATPDPDWNNSSSTSIIKHTRRCREDLFLARKPSWICQNCARRFSSAGWLERHQSFCSFSKLTQDDSQEIDQDISQTTNGDVASEDEMDRSSDASFVLSPKSETKIRIERKSSSSVLLQTFSSSNSPLQPKMENHNCADDDESTKKPSYDEDPFCGLESSVLSCENCKEQFPSQSHLQRHWEDHTECKSHTSSESNGKDSGDCSSDSSVSSCKHCGKTFRKNRLLKRHQSMCHIGSKKKLWQCTKCFKAFRRQLHFEDHQKDCSKGKHITREIQRCENCSLLFPTQKKLLKHQAICCPDSNNHMIKLLKCLKCSLMFPSYKKQLKHRAVCCPDSDTDAKVCHLCSKVFIMHDRMAAHKKKCFKVAKNLS